MSGLAGLSGRKPIKLESYTLNEIIETSKRILLLYLKDDNFPIDRRADLAARMVGKLIVEKVEVKHDVSIDFTGRPALLEAVKNVLEVKAFPVEN